MTKFIGFSMATSIGVSKSTNIGINNVVHYLLCSWNNRIKLFIIQIHKRWFFLIWLYFTECTWTSQWNYKDPSWVWSWDRKIHSEDHRLASRPQGTYFCIPLSHKSRSIFLAHHKIPHFCWKNMKRLPEILKTMKCNIHVTWSCHFNITMASWVDVRPACSCLFFIFPSG